MTWVATWFGSPWVCHRETVCLIAAAGQFHIETDGSSEFDFMSIPTPLSWQHRATINGHLMVGWDSLPPFLHPSLWQRMHPGRWWIDVIDVTPGRNPTYYVFVPIWMPLVALAVPSALAWWRRLRRFRPGQCRQCGYDRAGLGAGVVCPECGGAPLPDDSPRW